MVSKEKREELAKKFQELSRFAWWEAIEYDDMERALILVDEVIKVGWVPIEDFPDEELPAPTQAVVNDVMERILLGLPERVLKPVNPEGNAVYPKGKLYDVASLHPVEVNLNDLAKSGNYHFKNSSEPTWSVIPNYENYEICKDGEVRNKWTRRLMEVEYRGCETFIEMHDKQGFPVMVSTMELAKIADEICD